MNFEGFLTPNEYRKYQNKIRGTKFKPLTEKDCFENRFVLPIRNCEIDDILIEGAKHRMNQFYSRN